MPIFLNPRFGMFLLVGLPLAGGAAVNPQGATAFLLGAWVGVLMAGPPVMIVAWLMGVKTVGQVVAPLFSLPALLILSGGLLVISGEVSALGAQAAAAGGLAWWLKRRRFLF